ncbi:hypothetical protein [Crocosphaera sp.]|uniref:hypothetical protein n=1 Tax=Crocosphaera sp. TaxID=2729996 RepID=UPI003F22A735|nr:hypothetical protein [Crocosphaera sp.]
MENKRPEFAIQEHSVLSIATEMHNHFRDLQSYYKIAKGNLMSQLESMNDEAQMTEIQDKLREIEEKITFFHVLNNAISTVDTVLHTEKMIAEFNHKK